MVQAVIAYDRDLNSGRRVAYVGLNTPHRERKGNQNKETLNDAAVITNGIKHGELVAEGNKATPKRRVRLERKRGTLTFGCYQSRRFFTLQLAAEMPEKIWPRSYAKPR